jgi:hypothetical protein
VLPARQARHRSSSFLVAQRVAGRTSAESIKNKQVLKSESIKNKQVRIHQTSATGAKFDWGILISQEQTSAESIEKPSCRV